jgi:O-antigen/teichoic acid export membrane protein
LTEVAQYSLVFPLYLALVSVVGAAGGSMWSHYGRLRTTGRPSAAAMARVTAGLGLVGGVLGLLLVVAGPIVVRFMAGGEEAAPTGVYLAFALVIVATAVWLPLSMLFTDPSGLRFQAIGSVAMAVLNVVLSVLLARHLGAAGPPMATVIALATTLILPGVLRFQRLR